MAAVRPGWLEKKGSQRGTGSVLCLKWRDKSAFNPAHTEAAESASLLAFGVQGHTRAAQGLPARAGATPLPLDAASDVAARVVVVHARAVCMPWRLRRHLETPWI